MTAMPSAEALRYASAGDGRIHVVVDYRPATCTYLARCGVRISAKSAEVWRSSDEPGVICARCRAVPANDTATT